MPIDASIYGALGTRPMSSLDYAQKYNALDQQQNALQQGRLAVQQAQAVAQQRNGLRDALQSGGLDLTNPLHQAQAVAQFPDVAPGMLDALQKSATSRALAYKDTGLGTEAMSRSGQLNAQTIRDATKGAATFVMANPTPENARRAVLKLALDHGGDPSGDLAELAQLGSDPAAIKQWAAGHALAADKLLPTLGSTNLGGAEQYTARDPLTGALTVSASQPRIQTPESIASNATTQRGQNIAAQTAREGHAIEAAKADPFGTLGLNKNVSPLAAAGANLSGDEYLKTLPPAVAAQVKGIAGGKVAITPMSMRNPQMAQLLTMAMQYEPGTDQTTYISRAATAKDAASGKLATSNNALNTVAGHLAGLADAADKLGNTSLPWVNSVKNFVSNATGDPRVKEFNLNMQGVADELERAYRGAGGSEGSIKLWRSNLGDANSPEQFKGVLAKGAEMLQSKLEANQAQYEQGMKGRPGEYQTITPKARDALDRLRGTTAAGQAPATPAVPADIAAILKKHGQ